MLMLGALMVLGVGVTSLFGDSIRAQQYVRPVPVAVESVAEALSVAPGPISPESLFIPARGVNTIVEPAGALDALNPHTGQVVPTFPVPGGPFTTVWWQEGAAPGDDGMAVILGHARSGRAAVFNELGSLEPGDVVGVSGVNPTGQDVVARYLVSEVVAQVSKADPKALPHVLARAPGGAVLALITCSGDVDSELESFTDNTVIFATLEGVYAE